MIRQAYLAGSWYESDPSACHAAVSRLMDQAEPPADLPEILFGGLVPHAGWAFSGRLAALTLRAMSARGRLDRVVVFGTDHRGLSRLGAVFDEGQWDTPLGLVAVDEELARELVAGGWRLESDLRPRPNENSIEVQMPLIRHLKPDVRVVPIYVPPTSEAAAIGTAVGQVLRKGFPQAGVVGSTDLTHYGPGYSFTPGGAGRDGRAWAEANDRRMLDLIAAMKAEEVVAEAGARHNACGGGAIAATIAATAALGATRGVVLDYTSSAEVMAETYGRHPEDAVGYASVVFA